MPHRQSGASANPMVGIYFGIFAACLAAIVIVLLILEQMGIADLTLKAGMAFGSMGLFAAVGAGAATARVNEFLQAGRRVPAFYNGLCMAVVAFGGAGLAAAAGSLLLVGFDMLFLGLGLVAGFVVMVMLIAPYLRKFGAPTIPGFLGQRFDSGPVRLLAASIAVVPLTLVLVAEIKMALQVSSWLIPLAPSVTAGLVILVLIATVAAGGVRSLSWSSSAQALAVLVAVLVPAAIAAILLTNLPFGQLSHGPLLRAIWRAEATQSAGVPLGGIMAFQIPAAGLQTLGGRFATAFGTIGPLAFVLATISVMAGVAGSPILLQRAMPTPSVYDTRKSIGWAVVLVGLLLTTFSSVAVFERHILMTEVIGQPSSRVPSALQDLASHGWAAIDTSQRRIAPEAVRIDRDAALVALPVLLSMPGVVVSLVAAGLLAASLAGAAASLTQLGLIFGEDVVNAPDSWRQTDFHRLATCRTAIAVLATLAGVGAVLVDGDPFLLMLDGLAISGSTLFPVLLLAIWQKRTNAEGAFAGLGAGFVVALGVILASGVSGLPSLLAPAVAAPCALLVAAAVSRVMPVPGRHILEAVRDLRVPGGEPIADRELRLARQRHASGG